MDEWPDLWSEALAACKSLGGEIVRPLTIAPPANVHDVESVESAIGRSLPLGLRQTLMEFSSGVDFCWSLFDKVEPPKQFGEIFSGGITWSLEGLVEAEKERRGWQTNVFRNADDPYDKVWQNKLGWLVVPNGDVIAFDNNGKPDSPIIYLSHDDGQGHGYVLGSDFISFVTQWSYLGCPGPEDWQMLPFLPNRHDGIKPDCQNARDWREWFGMGK